VGRLDWRMGGGWAAMEGVGDVEGRCGMMDEGGEDMPVMGVGGAVLMGSREGGEGLEGELGKTGWGGGTW
jgi:hypothetical protein